MRTARVLLWMSPLLASCASVAIPHATEAQTVQARGRWAEVTPDSLEAGRNLYVARCGGCHSLVAPAKETPAAWPGLVDKMAPRAKLDAAQKDLVLRYLLTVSESP